MFRSVNTLFAKCGEFFSKQSTWKYKSIVNVILFCMWNWSERRMSNTSCCWINQGGQTKNRKGRLYTWPSVRVGWQWEWGGGAALAEARQLQSSARSLTLSWGIRLTCICVSECFTADKFSGRSTALMWLFHSNKDELGPRLTIVLSDSQKCLGGPKLPMTLTRGIHMRRSNLQVRKWESGVVRQCWRARGSLWTSRYRIRSRAAAS